jgi:hypothetical protein
MPWKPEKAKEWILITARGLMSDAMGMPYSEDDQSGEPIRASAGALFYMLAQDQFFHTEAEFRKYMEEQVGWVDYEIDSVVREIDPVCENASHSTSLLLYGEPADFFKCVECGRVVCINCEGSTNKPELCDRCWEPERKNDAGQKP